ncbi:uncharacterized protein FRV6_16649 [Fusarium oxysporum]|uniref:Uncharacterized protein n=1 Tax=Fusarium oxysporum TaxID=5507 RepID=A0A2H3U3I4_FUSOX|nr:uncharacterized protein FRV6_16649 [Fusarium oxysporum]
MSQVRYLYRILSLDTLRPGVLASEAPQKARPPSQAHVPTMTQDPAVTEMLQWNDAHSGCGFEGRVTATDEPGTSLVNISLDGGRPAVAEEDVTFERKAFIDGVTYLLRALPRDLDVCELRRIQSALPEDVAHLDQAAVQQADGLTQSASGRPRSILHCSVQIIVVSLIFVLSFMLPYLMYLIRHIARMERKYKVFETVVGHGLSFVNSIGKQSLSLTETMCQMNYGKVGQALLEAFIWTVDRVARWMSEGLGECLHLYRSSHLH